MENLKMSTLLSWWCLSVAFLPGLLSTPYEEIRDNSLDVNHVIYGDITKMNDMFIEPADYEGWDSEEAYKDVPNGRRQNNGPQDPNWNSIVFELLSDPINKPGSDIYDFNKITKSWNNITRRYIPYDDPQDNMQYLEPKKKQELINVGLQYLINIRYKLIQCIKQKEPMKMYKRYRLGYLFNRLRRIQYEMSKITDQAHRQEYRVHTYALFKFYETSLLFHVDAQDVIELIKSIDAEPDDDLAEDTTIHDIIEFSNRTNTESSKR